VVCTGFHLHARYKTCIYHLPSVVTCKLYLAKSTIYKTSKQTLWPLVRKRTIPTERPPLVGEILYQLLRVEGCRMVSAADPPRSLISVF
jgi:hypothetical protein